MVEEFEKKCETYKLGFLKMWNLQIMRGCVCQYKSSRKEKNGK